MYRTKIVLIATMLMSACAFGQSSSIVRVTPYTRDMMKESNEAGVKEYLNLEAGTDVQAWDTDLDWLAANLNSFWKTLMAITTLTDGGLLIGNGTGAIEVVAAGTTSQILVGGGAATAPVYGTDIPTAVTIGSAYIYRAGGTDIPDADVADNITIDLATAATTATNIAGGVAGSIPVQSAAGVTTMLAPPVVDAIHGYDPDGDGNFWITDIVSGSDVMLLDGTQDMAADVNMGGFQVVNSPKHFVFDIIDPLATHTKTSGAINVWGVTDANIVIDSITVGGDSVSYEITGDLMWASTFISRASSPTTITPFDTTNGVRAATVASGGEIEAGNCLFILFDAPNAAMTQVNIDIEWHYQ